jgi:DNA-directed RNA polymerase specialized sigma subunit
MPDDHRHVLDWRYQEERSLNEIASLLGVTANAAPKLLLRAIEWVNRELEGPS